jgi:sugar lactone lactonase YvrE
MQTTRLVTIAAAPALILALAACAGKVPGKGSAAPEAQAKVTQVAVFDHQVTGVAVSRGRRVFVNFPRWTEDVPISVAELAADGQLKPYPDADWNTWRNARKNLAPAGNHWVCVQSVFADNAGNLWVVDAGAPANGPVVPGAPKLVKIELEANKVTQVIPFAPDVAKQASYVNDVRISPDGRYAYLTDSGAEGALIVVDLDAGEARRVLAGHPTTQVEKDVEVQADGKPLRRTDGRGVEFAADGIALSPDGEWLYWQALTGKTLYRVDTEALQDGSLPPDELAAHIETVGENGVADGLWMDANGRMYVTAPEEDAVKVRQGDVVTTLVDDKRLRWPDTFAQGPDGALYVTASRIQDMSWFRPQSGRKLETSLYRIDLAERTQ